MQSENFDNKVKQAAEQHHPNYDETAWSRMEKLLDQHLPQKKDDRRRIIFLLLFLLLIGAGAWLVISKPWKGQERSTGAVNVAQGKQTQSPSQPSINKPSLPAEKTSAIAPIEVDHSSGVIVPAQDNDRIMNKIKNDQAAQQKLPKALVPHKSFSRKEEANNQFTVDQNNPDKVRQSNNRALNNDITKEDKTTIVSLPADQDKDVDVSQNKITSNGPANSSVIPAIKPADTLKSKMIEDIAAVASKEEPGKETEKKQVAKKTVVKRNSFFFSFSAGPDRTWVKDNPGKVRLLAGAGAGFTIHDRWTIRTGFYASNKVYSASKYDYKPTTPVVNPNYLDEIDANCRVYEIPVNLSYNFSHSDKHSVFASTGLSSFIMKKEDYTYLYKWPGNPPMSYTYTKTINNENKHYFSILTLSGGYEYRLNKTFSLSAEPYLKLPLSGIGFGKVKLSSAGVLFSANIRPFH